MHELTHSLAFTPDLIAQFKHGQHSSDRPDGYYLTGIVYPGLITFPTDECSTYTAAAVILAADAIGACSPASDLFVNHSKLPDVIDVEPLLVDADHEGPFWLPKRD